MAATEWVNLRVTSNEKSSTEAVVGDVLREFPVLTRAQVLRAALREGLLILKKAPKRALMGSAVAANRV